MTAPFDTAPPPAGTGHLPPAARLADAKRSAMARFRSIAPAVPWPYHHGIPPWLHGLGIAADALLAYVDTREDMPDPRHLPGRIAGVPLRVVPTRGFAAFGRFPPPSLGLRDSTSFGTLGAIVERAGTHYALAAGHTLAPPGPLALGTTVLHPAAADGGIMPFDQFARVRSRTDLLFANGTTNRVDAAIADILHGTRSRLSASMKPARHPHRTALPGQHATKTGRATGTTRGSIETVAFSGRVHLPPFGTAWFDDQLVVVSGPGRFAGPAIPEASSSMTSSAPLPWLSAAIPRARRSPRRSETSFGPCRSNSPAC